MTLPLGVTRLFPFTAAVGLDALFSGVLAGVFAVAS
jgi:hypothetical protein